ncbi:winged helix-turn-helix domain-containing protein [Rhizobium mayense]|uniref:Winged helix-turn-helix domain-containing protein n=1 Tax=Rhizobium mayense TaxID=1312184 RepID=A0ABT7K4H6_9HYPH|nr:winged helix-turn-helix domain-containing protein [Rhizobium mayense]MDL2403513.1 winged helix-turn-helix domain-containing protein [Rhizobium mayense]
MKHILIVDDDETLRQYLVDCLSQNGFKATSVIDGATMKVAITDNVVDLVIVDLNLGHQDGMDIVRELATGSDLPIMIVSGDRLDEADKILGLELGASDFMEKPFGTLELIARIRTLLRDRSVDGEHGELRIYSFSGWTLVHRTHLLTASNGIETKLTATEFNMLVAFLEAPGETLSREELLAATRTDTEEVFDRSIDVVVLRLRRKLERDASKPSLIRTVRGVGYLLDCEVDVSYGFI